MNRRIQNQTPIIEAEYVVLPPHQRWLRRVWTRIWTARATYGLWGLVIRLLIVATLLAIGCVSGFLLALFSLYRP